MYCANGSFPFGCWLSTLSSVIHRLSPGPHTLPNNLILFGGVALWQLTLPVGLLLRELQAELLLPRGAVCGLEGAAGHTLTPPPMVLIHCSLPAHMYTSIDCISSVYGGTFWNNTVSDMWRKRKWVLCNGDFLALSQCTHNWTWLSFLAFQERSHIIWSLLVLPYP